MENIFTEIYEKCVWGNNNENEYLGSSGFGSSLSFNEEYISFLKKFIIENNINSIIDLGCGDFRCGKIIYDDLNIIYNGFDAYKKVIDYNKKIYISDKKFNFTHLDFYTEKEKIPSGDLCILKDVIQHWSLESIYIYMDYLTTVKKFKYILICNCSFQDADNTNIQNGGFRYLSCNYLPLKKYNPILLFKYKSKEISLIKL